MTNNIVGLIFYHLPCYALILLVCWLDFFDNFYWYLEHLVLLIFVVVHLLQLVDALGMICGKEKLGMFKINYSAYYLYQREASLKMFQENYSIV